LEETRKLSTTSNIVLWLSIGLLILLHLVIVEKEVLPIQHELAGLDAVSAVVKFDIGAALPSKPADPKQLEASWEQLRKQYFRDPRSQKPIWNIGPIEKVGQQITILKAARGRVGPLLVTLNEAVSSLSDSNELILDSNLTRYHLIELLTHTLPDTVTRIHQEKKLSWSYSELERINHSLSVGGIPESVRGAAKRLIAATSVRDAYAAANEFSDQLTHAIRQLLFVQVQSYRLFEGTAVFIGALALLVCLLLTRALSFPSSTYADPRGAAMRGVRVLSLLIILGGCFGAVVWPHEIPHTLAFAMLDVGVGLIAFAMTQLPKRATLLASSLAILGLSAVMFFTEAYLTLQFLSVGAKFPPFLGFKVFPFIIAILAPPPAIFSSSIIILAGIIPLIEYFTIFPHSLRSALPLGEPWMAIFYSGTALVIFAYRNMEMNYDRNLAVAIADKEATEKLLRSESRFRRLAESNLLGIAHTTTTGKVLEANQYFYDLVGYTAEDFESGGIGWDTISAPEFRGAQENYVRQVLQQGSAPPYEKVYIRKNGERVWALVGSALLDGTSDEMITMILDVTERKALQKEREELLVKETRAHQEAEKTIKLRDEFITSASHELRTPLTPLKLWIQLQKQMIRTEPLASLPQAEKLLRSVDFMDRQVDRMGNLVEMMLTVVSIDAGDLALDPLDCDLSELVRAAIKQYETPLERAHCTLSTELQNGIRGNWDPQKVKQAIGSLLANSIKFGPNRSIEISTSQNGGIARIKVQDHGIGLSPEVKECLFGRFQKSVPAQQYGGLGLGLYIAKSIVDAHGGTILCEGSPDDGATFTIELPAAARENAGETEVAARAG